MIGALRKPTELMIDNPENVLITIMSIIIGVVIVFSVGFYKFYLDKKAIAS